MGYGKTKAKGGLGVGFLQSLNIALLAKWWWKLKVEVNSFWCSCIKDLHKTNCINGKPFSKM